MEVVDITTYNNQLELLSLRVNILQDVVDRFYVVQATKTHQGTPKECLDFKHPKVQMVTIDFPEGLDNWGRENYQRDYRVDLSLFGQDAIVMNSDLDEIPSPESIIWLKENFNPQKVYLFNQRMFQYYLNNRNWSEEWYGTRAYSMESYHKFGAQKIRTMKAAILPDAGWHFSFLGGLEEVKTKIKTYAHAEFNNEGILSSIEEQMEKNEDVFHRGFKLEAVPIDESYPAYIRDHQEELAHLIKL